MIEKIGNIIIKALLELNEELENDLLASPSKETKIYGAYGVLDSLALVYLITDLEERISDEFGIEIVLADEKAMSHMNSPFNSVETLANYIEKLLSE